MYVEKSLDHKVLNHLNALEDEFETLWIEINTGPKSKNIIVCCTYRHPDTDASKFTVYLESILSKIDKNKTICIFLYEFPRLKLTWSRPDSGLVSPF